LIASTTALLVYKSLMVVEIWCVNGGFDVIKLWLLL